MDSFLPVEFTRMNREEDVKPILTNGNNDNRKWDVNPMFLPRTDSCATEPIRQFYLQFLNNVVGNGEVSGVSSPDGETVDDEMQHNVRIVELEVELQAERQGRLEAEEMVEQLVERLGVADSQISHLTKANVEAQLQRVKFEVESVEEVEESKRKIQARLSKQTFSTEFKDLQLKLERETQETMKKLEADYNELKAEHKELKAEHKDLKAEHKELKAEYKELKAEHKELKERT